MAASMPTFDPLAKWRHNSDSNAGNDCSFNGFQDRLLKPLGHCATTINILYSKHFYHSILHNSIFYNMVLRAGLEPARCLHQGILSPLCLPIPPSEQIKEDNLPLVLAAGIEPVLCLIRTLGYKPSALPVCYASI